MSLKKYRLPNPKTEEEETLYKILQQFMREVEAEFTTDEKYFGDPQDDGSWRIKKEGTTFIHQRKESGSWVTKNTITS